MKPCQVLDEFRLDFPGKLGRHYRMKTLTWLCARLLLVRKESRKRESLLLPVCDHVSDSSCSSYSCSYFQATYLYNDQKQDSYIIAKETGGRMKTSTWAVKIDRTKGKREARVNSVLFAKVSKQESLNRLSGSSSFYSKLCLIPGTSRGNSAPDTLRLSSNSENPVSRRRYCETIGMKLCVY